MSRFQGRLLKCVACPSQVSERATDTCSNFLFAILDITTATSIHPGPPARDFDSEGWLEQLRGEEFALSESRHVSMHGIESSVVADIVQLPICLWYGCSQGQKASRVSCGAAWLKQDAVIAEVVSFLDGMVSSMPYINIRRKGRKRREQNMKGKYMGSKGRSPHQVMKRGFLGLRHHITSPARKEERDSLLAKSLDENSTGLQGNSSSNMGQMQCRWQPAERQARTCYSPGPDKSSLLNFVGERAPRTDIGCRKPKTR
eukprot:1146870-Pelagomonas_calceolata.AAC.1